ncbi:hypothetical protein WAJ21_20585, partial [Acinetobacter baumannii]
KSLISGDAFSRQIGLMTSNMRNYFKDRGHTIHLAFKVDHETPYAIHDLNAMQKATTARCAMNLDIIIDEMTETISGGVFNESCYIALIS